MSNQNHNKVLKSKHEVIIIKYQIQITISNKNQCWQKYRTLQNSDAKMSVT